METVGLVCPDCSNGPDQCTCDNGIKIPKLKAVKVKMPKVKMKHDNFDRNLTIETVQQSFPFMKDYAN